MTLMQVAFDKVELPKEAMLNRYADVINDQYVQENSKIPPFAMIGQRLYTGRVAVAQAALEYRRHLFEVTKVRCAFFDRYLRSRMSLVPTHARLKLLHACDQCHSSWVNSRL
jgi:hypothetical protein